MEHKEEQTKSIHLVRYAFVRRVQLASLFHSAKQPFNLLHGQVCRSITAGQIELMRQVLNYIASNGYCTITDIKENDKTQAAQLIRAFGGRDTANEALSSLSQFIIYRKLA